MPSSLRIEKSMVVKRRGNVSMIIKALLVKTSHPGFPARVCPINDGGGCFRARCGPGAILGVCGRGLERRAGDGCTQCPGWELIVLLCARCLRDSALALTAPFSAEQWHTETQKRFLPFPPSPGWPLGPSEEENSKLEAEGRPNIVCVLCWRCRLRGVNGAGAHEVRLGSALH